jgi:hypothetical protein
MPRRMAAGDHLWTVQYSAGPEKTGAEPLLQVRDWLRYARHSTSPPEEQVPGQANSPRMFQCYFYQSG